MDPNSASASGGGGPAPFLLKTYDMVDDSSTDEIVSWSSGKKSFVVWNPPEFARLLLPAYFKHNNFSSFIRQLNTYGFRKIDPEKWEFANEEFVKDQKHLLKNIHRRKPIHSHSHPHGALVDPERAAFEEEIERLSREKAKLEADVMMFRKQRSAAKLQLDELTCRIDGVEHRQDNLIAFFVKAIRNPTFVENLICKIESMDISAYSKKRRLPEIDNSKPSAETSLQDNSNRSRPESGNIFHQDFSNKLRLELSPAVSDINLVSHSAQSSNEDGASPQRMISGEDPKDAPRRTEGLLFPSETVELSDTGTSFTFRMDSYLQPKATTNGSARADSLSLPQRLASSDELDGHVSCQLNLSLASSPLQDNKSPYSTRMPQLSQHTRKPSDAMSLSNTRESESVAFQTDRDTGDKEKTVSPLKEAPKRNQEPAAPAARVNDMFWEQFLTERPGSSDNEEASSSFRGSPYDEPEERRHSHGLPKNAKNIEQLSL